MLLQNPFLTKFTQLKNKKKFNNCIVHVNHLSNLTCCEDEHWAAAFETIASSTVEKMRDVMLRRLGWVIENVVGLYTG